MVDEIVRRVMVRLTENGNATTGPTRFEGPLLTCEILDALPLPPKSSPGIRLSVGARCVVTPEVIDRLRERDIVLLRHDGSRSTRDGSQTRSAASHPVVIWRWLSTGTPENYPERHHPGFDVQDWTESPADLVRHLQSSGAADTCHVLITDQPLAMQRELNRERLFAVVARLIDHQWLDELAKVRPDVTLVPPPVTSWGIRRLVRVLSRELTSERGSKHQGGRR